MLSVVERIDILDEAKQLSASRSFRDVVSLLADLPPQLLLAEPELGHYLAQAYSQIDRQTEADKLLAALNEACWNRGNDRLFRRRLNLQAVANVRRGQLVLAEALLLDVQLASDVAGDTTFLATATMNLGVVADMKCDWDSAASYYHYALVLFQQLGDRASTAGCYHNLGMLHRQRGQLQEAEAYLQRAMENYRPTGTDEERISTGLERALVVLAQGDHARAAALAEKCLGRARRLENPRLVGESLRAVGIAQAALRRYSVAKRAYQDALQIEARHENLFLRAELLEELAMLSRETNPDEGLALLTAAMVCFDQMGSRARADRAKERYHQL